MQLEAKTAGREDGGTRMQLEAKTAGREARGEKKQIKKALEI
jgi:hypothetical protein